MAKSRQCIKNIYSCIAYTINYEVSLQQEKYISNKNTQNVYSTWTRKGVQSGT